MASREVGAKLGTTYAEQVPAGALRAYDDASATRVLGDGRLEAFLTDHENTLLGCAVEGAQSAAEYASC